MYYWLRYLFFILPAEFTHHLVLSVLKTLVCLNLMPKKPQTSLKLISIMGLQFPNHVGLAAGLDKNGDYIDALAALGFGFIEIGTITPRPQPGNPKPRLFRLPKIEALINRMGFNNKGVDYLVTQVKNTKYTGVLGINIGKNFDTPIQNAIDDYLICMRKVYPYASYITVNISSPNTKDLRELQKDIYLEELLSTLKLEQQKLTEQHKKYVPLALKIAPDLNLDEIKYIAQALINYQWDAVIATNTTIARTGTKALKYSEEKGGLSGKPLFNTSTEVVGQLHKYLANKIPIIAAGGIMSAADAQAKIAAGAKLVQVYTGLIYHGPNLIKEIAKQVNDKVD